MNIDRIARAMTGGRPRTDFTARVMAPIYGRPRPGFTASVMAHAAAPGVTPASARTVGRGFSPGARGAALLLVPAAVVLVAGVMAARVSRVEVLATPAAPKLATASLDLSSPAVLQTPVASLPPRVARRMPIHAPVEEPAAVELPAIYMIPALDGPDDIAMRSIEPPAVTIPALDAPAPLKVADLPGAPDGSQQKVVKE